MAAPSLVAQERTNQARRSTEHVCFSAPHAGCAQQAHAHRRPMRASPASPLSDVGVQEVDYLGVHLGRPAAAPVLRAGYLEELGAAAAFAHAGAEAHALPHRYDGVLVALYEHERGHGASGHYVRGRAGVAQHARRVALVVVLEHLVRLEGHLALAGAQLLPSARRSSTRCSKSFGP